MKNEAIIGGIVLGGQPDAADVNSGRFAHIVNCRPDDEPGNVTAELVRGTAVGYTSIPYTAETLNRSHVDRMREVLDTTAGTILVHCQGGTRAAVAVAIVLAERAGEGAAEVFAALDKAGYDVLGRPYEAFIRSYFAR